MLAVQAFLASNDWIDSKKINYYSLTFQTHPYLQALFLGEHAPKD